MDDTTKYLIIGSTVLSIGSSLYSMWVHRRMYELTTEVADFFHVDLGTGKTKTASAESAAGGDTEQSTASSILDAVFG